MKIVIRSAFCCFLATTFLVVSLMGADTTLRGTVTDNAGKPVRGAIVKATMGDKTISRFTQKDGRDQISVPPGSYAITVDAYGYAIKRQTKETSQAGNVDFSITPKWDVTRLTGADITPLVADDKPGKLLKAVCIECHDFSVVMAKRGMTSAEWQSFLPEMPAGKRPGRNWTKSQLEQLGSALEKYFGPDSKYFGPDAEPPAPAEVKHPVLADAVLSATFREYTVPTGVQSLPHSIFLDPASKTAWFSEIGLRANKIASFDLATEKFKEYPVPIPKSNPHSGVVGKDGRVWLTLATPGIPGKIVSLDPATGEIKTYDNPGDQGYTHTMIEDQDGTMWISGDGVDGGSGQVWSFNVKTEKFKIYKFPAPEKFPETSRGSWDTYGEDKPAKYNTYHLNVDSKGMVWATTLKYGMLVKINPANGEVKEYFPPDVPGIRGMAVDGNDNIWFADYYNHQLGMLDQKTGKFKMYHPPTRGAGGYGIVVDKKSGYVWYADQVGNYISRFDPKTEQFAEYPIPTRGAIPRFIDMDKQGRIWFGEWWTGKIGVLDPGVAPSQVASR
ncbi:MAG TPA: carboxypeptidase regulatory-like domain-containing protein [Terriglobales bacterium]|nr:carboxypeptidase regulatory-like domain-containing protein [Terriglobales bacterium]